MLHFPFVSLSLLTYSTDAMITWLLCMCMWQFVVFPKYLDFADCLCYYHTILLLPSPMCSCMTHCNVHYSCILNYSSTMKWFPHLKCLHWQNACLFVWCILPLIVPNSPLSRKCQVIRHLLGNLMTLKELIKKSVAFKKKLLSNALKNRLTRKNGFHHL